MVLLEGTSTISLLDYFVFFFSLVLSLGTGVYHAIKSHILVRSKLLKGSQRDEYMMGERKMPLVPVALSLLTTFLSGILMLGVPTEMFQKGAHIWLNFVIGGFSSAVSAWVFLPIFYKMRATCLHEYFIHRFDSQLLRQTFSTLFLTLNLTYTAVVLYAPSVALSPILQIDKYLLIMILGTTTTLYTTIGGLKAVVWTDSLQAVLMYAGVLAVIYKGLNHPRVGGFSRVWQIAKDSGRIDDAWRLDVNPAQYNSMWINIFSGTVTWLATFGVNQLAVQRYCSLPTVQDAKLIIYWTILPFVCLCSIVAFVGFIVLAYFFNCNPLETGEISDMDHLTIIFAKEVLSPTPGFFGLYVSCIMSATLSTLSSGMNSMAAAAYEDFLKHRYETKISDSKATLINKGFVMLFGLLSTVLAFAAEPLGGILRVCISVFGALSGPFVGIFVFAMFWPKAGTKSTFISFIATNFIMVVICCMNYYEDPFRDLFFSTNSTAEGCNNMNFTVRLQPSYDAQYGLPNTSYFARLSTYSYSGIGMILMLAIGIPLSFVFREKNLVKNVHLTYYGRNLPWPMRRLRTLPKANDRLLSASLRIGNEPILLSDAVKA